MFTHWDDVVSPELHRVYGIDTESTEYEARPWWWVRARIYALLETDSVLARSLAEVRSNT